MSKRALIQLLRKGAFSSYHYFIPQENGRPVKLGPLIRSLNMVGGSLLLHEPNLPNIILIIMRLQVLLDDGGHLVAKLGRNLLEREEARLGQEEVVHGAGKGVAADEDEVELPRDGIEGVRGRVVEPDGGERLGEDGEADTDGAQVEGEDLGDEHPVDAVEVEGVAEREEVDKGNTRTRDGNSIEPLVSRVARQRGEDREEEREDEVARDNGTATRPVVGDEEDVEDLADDGHEAVETAEKQDGAALIAEGLVHDGLVGLDDVGAGELHHLHGEDDEQRAADVLAGEDGAEVGHVLALGLELDLLAHLGELGLDGLGAAVLVEVVHDLLGLVVAFLHGH
jgi:hypothetical protein